MSDERRYREDEVAEIFERAAAPVTTRRGGRSAEGLTLSELQAIGREVGIAPDRIAAAASSLERRQLPVPRQTAFGLPVGVGRTEELPRPLTDREWSLLVTELRATFGATGRVDEHGETRHWRNGNLHAFVEPTEEGYRLRLGTVKGDALAVNAFAAGGILMTLVLMLLKLVADSAGGDVADTLMFGILGVGAFAFNALRLPRWAREREEQMDHIVERTRALIARAPTPED